MNACMSCVKSFNFCDNVVCVLVCVHARSGRGTRERECFFFLMQNGGMLREEDVLGFRIKYRIFRFENNKLPLIALFGTFDKFTSIGVFISLLYMYARTPKLIIFYEQYLLFAVLHRSQWNRSKKHLETCCSLTVLYLRQKRDICIDQLLKLNLAKVIGCSFGAAPGFSHITGWLTSMK